MTTEYGDSDVPRATERRGLSRRQMIKASAVAGAAAWTAPVIIDSLASPAAATSGCKPYWVKLTSGGACNSNCFGSGSGVDFPLGGNPVGSGNNPDAAKWGGSCAYPGDCGNGDGGDGDTRMPSSVTAVTLDGFTYYKVTFNSNGCTYSNQTAWQIGGRYSPATPARSSRRSPPRPRRRPARPAAPPGAIGPGPTRPGSRSTGQQQRRRAELHLQPVLLHELIRRARTGPAGPR